MIEKIYIVNDAGLCLFSKSYKEETKEDEANLITGFLTSLDKFIQNTADAGTINEIKLQNATFKYKNYKKFKIIVKISDVSNKEEDSRKLELIGDLFLDKYEKVLDSWDGNTDVFNQFLRIIDDILNKNENDFFNFVRMFKKTLSTSKEKERYIEELTEFKNILFQRYKENDKIIKSVDNWINKIRNFKNFLIDDKDLKKLSKSFENWEKEGLKKFQAAVFDRIDSL